MSAGELWRRLRSAFGAGRMRDDMMDEMRLHLELRAKANRESGMPPGEAERAAQRGFGNAGWLAERARDEWGWAWLDALRQDARYALRQIAHAPLFAVVAIVTCGIGLGLCTAAFTVYDSFALKPLPVRAPGEIVRVVRQGDRTTIDELPWSTVDRIRRGARSVDRVVVTSAPEIFVSGSTGADEPVTARFVSPDYFDMLGVAPSSGAVQPEGVIVSHNFWERRLHADPGAVGRTMTVQGVPVLVSGVAPAGFAGTGLPPSAPDLWAPMALQPLLMPGNDWVAADAEKWQVLARRTSGASAEQASAEMAVLAQSLPADSGRAVVLRVKPATFFQTDSGEFETFGQLIRVLMVAVGLILVIGSLNLVNLLAARNAAREREVSMRLALGASRARIARQLTTESAVLGILGGLCGMVLSVWLCRLLARWITGSLIQVTGGSALVTLDFSPSWRVFGWSAALAVVVGIAVGLWPAVRAARGDVNALLKQGATEPRHRGTRRHLLLTVQIAGCLVLLSGAGMLLAGLWRSREVQPGFDTRHVLVLDPGTITGSPDRRAASIRALRQRLAAVPGIRAVAWSDRVPYIGHALRSFRHLGSGEVLTFAWSHVSPEWFDATGIPLVQGRTFTPEEAEQERHVLIVSESLWRRLWPGQDVVGRVMPPSAWLAASDTAASYTVIGIARDARNTYLSRVDEGYEYFPAPPSRGFVFLLRTTNDPATMIKPVFSALAELSPDLPAHVHLVTMEDGPLALQRMMSSAPASLAGGLALLSLLLAGVSLFGLVAHGVIRRTREIGVRVALGAGRRRILAMILGDGLVAVAWGAILGALGSAAAGAALGNLLAAPDAPDLTYGTGTFNPLVFGAVLGVLGVVVVTASLAPALRATRVDAMVALRQD